MAPPARRYRVLVAGDYPFCAARPRLLWNAVAPDRRYKPVALVAGDVVLERGGIGSPGDDARSLFVSLPRGRVCLVPAEALQPVAVESAPVGNIVTES